MKKIIIICLLLLTIGCAKKSISVDKFKSTVRSEGYYVISTEEQFSQYKYIESSLMARKDGVGIEFYIMTDEENTKAFYDYNKDIIEAHKTKYDTYKETKTKYVLETDEKYMVISYIKNTCIYVDTDIKNKDKVNSIIKKLGY